MASKLHANAIITGNLDSFCLVCEYILRTEDEACKHVHKPLHQKKLALVPYSDKFVGDRIRKVKMGYYCEFCNILLSIISKVNLHIAEEKHKHNKGCLLLKRVGSDVIAFDNVAISGKSWHGIMGDVCVLCNTEFDDECVHTSAFTHLLNSVQKTVKFGANNAIYRKVDDNTIQCLTCEIILASNTMNEHFNNSNHLHVYDKCQKDKNNNLNTKDNTPNNTPLLIGDTFNKTEVNEETIDKISPEDMKSKILDSIGTYQKHAININLENETAFCKKCLMTVNFDYTDIENHVRDHATLLNGNINTDLLYPCQIDGNLNRVDIKEGAAVPSSNKADQELPNAICEDSPDKTCRNDNKTDPKKSTSNEKDAMILAKSNQITYNANDSKAYCCVCKKTFSSSLKCIQEHVAGAGHKKMIKTTQKQENAAKEQVKLTSTKPKKITKQASKTFIKNACTVTSMIFEDVVVINRNYCISLLSFLMITKFDSKLRCQACEENVPYYGDVLTHNETTKHEKAMDETPVVTSVHSEFIREIRPGLFHCGFCNLIVANWTEMENHLKCDSHATKRSHYTGQLQRHLPGVIRHQQREFLSNFFNMF